MAKPNTEVEVKTYVEKIDKLIETDRQKELLRQQEISNVDNRHAIRLQRLHDI